MNMILRPFWHPVDRRLRSFWRLSLHQLLITVFVIIVDAVIAGQLDGTVFNGLAIVAATYLAARFLDRRPIADLGLQCTARWWRDLGFGLALGALLMLLIFLIELALGWIRLENTFSTRLPYPFGLAILLSLARFMAVGIYEELVSRGYQLKNLAEGLSFAPLGPKGGILLALLLSSTIFGLLHAFNPNASVVSTVNLFLAGLCLSLPVLLTGELAIPIGMHITWNFFQGNVFGFPVSGTAVNHTTVIAVTQSGPDVWSGGVFGPEAGLLGIAAMLTGFLLIVWWVKRTRGTVGFCLSVAEYSRPTVVRNTTFQPNESSEEVE